MWKLDIRPSLLMDTFITKVSQFRGSVILSLLNFFRFSGETNEDTESTDGWEEEDEAEPVVPCSGLINLLLNFHSAATIYIFLMIVIYIRRLGMEVMVVVFCCKGSHGVRRHSLLPEMSYYNLAMT